MPKTKIMNDDASIIPLPKTVFTCSAGIIVCIVLSDLVGGYLQVHPDFPLKVSVLNGIFFGVLLAAVLYRISRGLTRDAGGMSEIPPNIFKIANYDPATGLPNRNLLMDRLNQLISFNIRDRRPTAVIYLGMDGFKEGAEAAVRQTVMQEFIGQLTEILGDTDTLASLNRDELAVLVGGEAREADLDLVIAKIRQLFATPFTIQSGEILVSASIGIACFPSDGLSGVVLLQHSKDAMNKAREQNNSFRYYSDTMDLKAMERLKIESGMMRGLEEGEFHLCYQPKYAWNGKDMTGMEATVRWRHNGEIIPPDKFIPLAEDAGMTVKLGEWVLREACRQNKDWQRQGLPAVQVAVNISARQLRDHDFADMVEGILKETGLEPGLLELEITESAIMGISDEIVLKLLRLKDLGVSLSIEEFGAGFSSLSYLKVLQVDKIKIDRSFVTYVVSDPDGAAIVDAIISIAHALNVCVIAEGVDNKWQFDFLVGRNCTQFQGDYFSKPLSAVHFANLLRARGMTAACKKTACFGRVARPAQQPPLAPLAPSESRPAEIETEPGTCGQMQDVARLVPPVSPQDSIIKVLSRFQLDMELKVLPVVEEEAVVGIVNRSTFFEVHMIGRQGYAAHINHSKKIRELMDPVEFIFDAATRIEDAAAILQPMISTLRIDNICIVRNGAYAGMIDVNGIFKAMTEIQIVLAKGANPLSGLPGNTSIERRICERLDSGLPFDIAYIDIDNFKPFNDYYGFQKGDEIIKRLAEIMETVIAASSWRETAFCGHIGGDDFILITESFQAQKLSEQIAAAFDEERPAFHGETDYANGGYRTCNRKGEPESFPLISLSVGIVNTAISPVGSYAKLASLSTEVKKAAKKTPGTSIVVDGRSAAREQREEAHPPTAAHLLAQECAAELLAGNGA